MKSLSASYRSKASGDYNAPIEIYDIFLDTQTLHLAQYDKNFTFYDLNGNSETYLAFPMKREPADRSSEGAIGSVKVNVANIDRSMSAYIASTDIRGRRVVIRKVFTDLVTSSGDAAVIFDGVMDAPTVSEETLEFNATDRVSLNREVPRQRYMLLCNHKFGNEECFYGKASGDMYGTHKGICDGVSSGLTITTTTLASGDDFFKDGEVVFTKGLNANLKRKVVRNNAVAKSMTIDYALPYTLVSGDTFTLRRSCDKSALRCSGDFNNGANFLGFPTIPQELIVR